MASAVTALLRTGRGTTAAPSTTRDSTILITPAAKACGAVIAARLEAVVARDIHEISLHQKDGTQRNAIAEAVAAASKAASFAVAEISSSGLVRSNSTSVAMTSPKIMHGSCAGENTHSLSNKSITPWNCGFGIRTYNASYGMQYKNKAHPSRRNPSGRMFPALVLF